MEEWQEDPKNQRHASTPGAELAAQREALGMTVDQIADQLKLAPRQVVALEKGDYESLPNMAVTRGFIRAYAKAVRLDPAPLVAMIEVEGALGHAAATVRPTKVAASFNESRFPTLTERQGKPIGAIVAGAVVVALLAAAGAWKAGLISPSMFGAHNAPAASAPADASGTGAGVSTTPLGTQPAGSGTVAAPGAAGTPGAEQSPLQSPNVPLISVPPQPGSSTGPATVPGAGVNPAPAAPAAQPAAPAATPNANPTPAAPAAPGVKPAATAPANVQPLAQAPAAAPAATLAAAAVASAAAPAAPAAAAAGERKLVLKVVEDSWIAIQRPNAKPLISRLVKAGSTESFDVRSKDLLVVGNSSGVQATLQGSPLELPQSNGKISRVNIN